MIILKVTKDQDLTLSLKNTFLENLQRGGCGGQIDPIFCAVLVLR